MRYEFKPSFERSIKALSPEGKAEIKAACLAFLDLLELRARLPIGIGLKHLDDDYWEIRKSLRYRILFRWRKDSIDAAWKPVSAEQRSMYSRLRFIRFSQTRKRFRQDQVPPRHEHPASTLSL